MTKKNVLWILLDLVFLVIFNVVFFVLGGSAHPASVWISYAFIHLAYLLMLLTPFLVKKSTSRAVFGFALYSVSSAYFLVEFVIGLIFILFSPDSYKAALVVQLILAGIYAIILISNMIANESTAESEQRHQSELVYVKTCSAKLKGAVDKISDKSIRRKVERAYDVIHGSQVKSSAAVIPLERQIDNLIDSLVTDVNIGNFDSAVNKAERIVSLAEERNRQLRISN